MWDSGSGGGLQYQASLGGNVPLTYPSLETPGPSDLQEAAFVRTLYGCVSETSGYLQARLASGFSFSSFFCFFNLMPEICSKRKTVPMVLDQKKNIEFAGF